MAISLIVQLPPALLLFAGIATGSSSLTQNSQNIPKPSASAEPASTPETKAAAIQRVITQECTSTILSYNVGGNRHVASSNGCTVRAQADGPAAKQ